MLSNPTIEKARFETRLGFIEPILSEILTLIFCKEAQARNLKTIFLKNLDVKIRPFQKFSDHFTITKCKQNNASCVSILIQYQWLSVKIFFEGTKGQFPNGLTNRIIK